MQNGKFEQLKEAITPMLDEILESLIKQDKIDHFEISIVNHAGTIQMDQVTKMRKKAY